MSIFQKVTLKNLKENRTRTLVTIVGIILSSAMFTATIVSISSLRHWLIQSTIFERGNWYGTIYGISASASDTLSSDQQLQESVSMELLGYSELKDCINEYKPYLCVYGIQQDFTNMMPVHLTQGRMPENSGELLLPDHLASNGNVKYDLEDTLTLHLSDRLDSLGNMLNNQTPYLQKNAGYMKQENSYYRKDKDDDSAEGTPVTEHLAEKETKTYRIVGFYERPSYEDYSAPGYTALTIGDNSKEHLYDLYVRTKSGKNSVPQINSMFSEIEEDNVTWQLNYDLLRLYGYSGESRYNQVLFSLGMILILIIMFGSISLIYNAFSISVSERTRQFGLLSSIGATRRQLTGSVLFEASFLGCIGIPLGLLSGFLGLGITFFFTKDMIISVLGLPGTFDGPGRRLLGGYEAGRLTQVFGPIGQISMKPHLSLPALVLAVSISLLTILISAYIPVKRALKRSAIDAIRQTNDIAIRPGKVKTSRFTEKVFGFEGMIATKNYKRNRKKYRATVISLFLSIVLFISTSSWCSYLTRSMGKVLDDHGYDIYYLKHSEVNYSTDTLRSELAQTEGVADSTYFSNLYLTGSINTAAASSQHQDYQKILAEQLDETYHSYDKTTMEVQLIFLEDHSFRRYLKEQNLPESVFFNHEKPAAVLVNSLQSYNGNDGKYYAYPLLSDVENADMKLYLTRQIDNDYGGYITTDEETGELCYNYWNSSDENVNIPLEEACQEIPISIGAAQTEAPDFFSNHSSYTQLFYPYSLMDDVFSSLDPETEYQEIYELPYSKTASDQLLFQCENHTKVTADMTKLLIEKGLSSENLHDYAASIESDRAMLTVVNVFAFGFITLISLIAAANVFNTISTNVNLRRREFAMLKSIGMTPKGFQKMMNFECLLYGFKGLLYGIPVSFFVTWLIYRSISAGLESGFFIPWHSIAIAVGSVFLVVFATMVYSMKKIQKENTIDILKNENL